MGRDEKWSNQDGLRVGFGTRTDENDAVSKIAANGSFETVVMEITGTELVDTIAQANLNEHSVRIPRGSVIRSATIQCTEAFVGTGTLDLGTYDYEGDAVDVADGIDADIDVDVALAAVGDIVQCDGALVNGAVSAGETSDSDVVITASFETSVPTAGKAVLTVEYVAPQYDAPLAV